MDLFALTVVDRSLVPYKMNNEQINFCYIHIGGKSIERFILISICINFEILNFEIDINIKI